MIAPSFRGLTLFESDEPLFAALEPDHQDVLRHLNPWLGIELTDTYQIRDSSVSGQGFSDNIVMVGLKFQE